MKRSRVIGGLVATGVAVAVGASVPAVAGNATHRATANSESAKSSSAAKAPGKAYVKHKAWRQKHNSWCVPASFQLSLRTFGVKVTQDSLAKQMHTNSTTTDAKDALRVYAKYLSPKGYDARFTNQPSASALMKVASYDVGIHHKAVPVGILLKDAPWAHTHSNLRHAVSLRGYDKAEGTVTIWDPSKSSYGGSHTIPVKDLAKAAHNGGIVFRPVKKS